MSQKDWSKYYENRKGKPVSKLLTTALPYAEKKLIALDLGAGSLKESDYLLNNGFEKVVAIDKSPLIKEFASTLNKNNFEYQNINFEKFNFKASTYDLVCAIYSLPFIKKENFKNVFDNIKFSLKNGGVFCGQFFGTNDDWSQDSNMSFHTKDEVEMVLKDLKVILLEEIEKDGHKADGNSKHWHFFNIIAKK
jgi:tellurite methyltransferase